MPEAGELCKIDLLFDMSEAFDIKLERDWFRKICSPDELERILNVQNANDHILRLRAEIIADDIRIYRVFLHKVREYEEKGWEWALEKYFRAYNYIDVLHSLDKEKEELCRQVSFGAIISNEPNGLIFESPYGICSTYSTTLEYFSRFACLAMLDFGKVVPRSVRIQAMRIAIRVMLQRESLDFDVDPRGIIPQDILDAIYPIYPMQITFIAAHEYSHLINGDLTKGGTIKQAVRKAHFKDETDYKMVDAYNISQQKEFKADLGALTYPKQPDDWYARIYYATMLWFASLAIYEAAEDTIFPPNGKQTHPGAKARYNNILENAPRPNNFSKKLYYETIPAMVDNWEDFVKQDVMENFEAYEMYGSLYLAAPNTEWRGRELIDRVDY